MPNSDKESASTMGNSGASSSQINKGKRKGSQASKKRAERRNRIKQKFGVKIRDRAVNKAGKCRNG